MLSSCSTVQGTPALPQRLKGHCSTGGDVSRTRTVPHRTCAVTSCAAGTVGQTAKVRGLGATPKAPRALVPTAVPPGSGTAASPHYTCRGGRILPSPCRAVPQLRLQSLVLARWRVPPRGEVLPPWLRLCLPAPVPRCQIRAGVTPSSRDFETGWGRPAVAACTLSPAPSCPQRNQASARWLRRLRWHRVAPPAPRTGSARGLRSAAIAADVATRAQPQNQVRRWSLEQ